MTNTSLRNCENPIIFFFGSLGMTDFSNPRTGNIQFLEVGITKEIFYRMKWEHLDKIG